MDQETILKINSWKRFSNTKLWLEMVAEVKKKIEECDIIINVIGGDSKVEFSKRDLAIIKKDAYYDLIRMPEDNVSALSGTSEAPIEDMDPYQDRQEEID